MTIVIGLTGGIATGKSTVSNMFVDASIPVIDTDKIARDVLHIDTDEYHRVVQLFTEDILLPNKEINRKKLGRIIFTNHVKREKLNQIVHPKVEEIVMDMISIYKKQQEKVIVVDVPLLFESGFDQLVDKVVVVYSTREKQINRLMERDHIKKEYALLKIEAQMPLEEKVDKADFVIDNSKSILQTKKDFQTVLEQIEVK